MVSGFLISPNDQLRILSGDAIPIRISSKVSGLAIGFAKFVSSFIFLLFLQPLSPLREREGPTASAVGGRGEGGQLPTPHPNPSPAEGEGLGFIIQPPTRSAARRLDPRCYRARR